MDYDGWCRDPLLGPTWCVLGLRFKQVTCRGHLWSWTPVFVPVWAFNSSFLSFSGAGRQNWAEDWRWTPVYVVYPCAKYGLLYIAGKPWMSTFQRNWKHAILSSVAPEYPLWVQGGQNPTASAVLFQPESDFCSTPSISARKYLKSQKNTQTHSKVQKYDYCLKTNKILLKTN